MEFQARLTATKDVIAIVREVLIIVGVLVLAFYPPLFPHWAKSMADASRQVGAKTSEFGIGPAKITFESATTQVDALVAAKQATEDVQKLAKQLAATASPENAERARQIETATLDVSSRLQTSIASAKNVQLAQDRILQSAQDAPGLATGEGKYGIVVSADKDDGQTSYEASNLQKHTTGKVTIYDRQGFLRTLAVYPDNDSARAELRTIQSYRQGAYLINVSKWCPVSHTERSLDGVPVLKCE